MRLGKASLVLVPLLQAGITAPCQLITFAYHSSSCAGAADVAGQGIAGAGAAAADSHHGRARLARGQLAGHFGARAGHAV